MKTWLCLLLSALAIGASAQSPSVLLFGGAATASISLPSLSSIGYRWEYTNLADGAVSSWVDTIAGNTWVQATGGAQPTKDSNGVTFASGKYLDATNTLNCGSGPALDVYVAIVKLNGLSEGYLIANGNPEAWMGINSGSQFYNQGGPFGSPGTGYWIDYIYAGKNGSVYQHYTNGVLAVSSSSQPEYSGAPSAIGRLGSIACCYFPGVLKDLIVWTNVVGFDSTTVAAVHRYATNRYSFSP